MMSKDDFATIGLRILAIGFLTVGLALILGNILETAWDFNPNYLGYFFATQLLRPLILLFTGGLLLVFSRKIGQSIGKC